MTHIGGEVIAHPVASQHLKEISQAIPISRWFFSRLLHPAADLLRDRSCRLSAIAADLGGDALSDLALRARINEIRSIGVGMSIYKTGGEGQLRKLKSASSLGISEIADRDNRVTGYAQVGGKGLTATSIIDASITKDEIKHDVQLGLVNVPSCLASERPQITCNTGRKRRVLNEADNMVAAYGIPVLLYHRLGRPQAASLVKGQYVSPGLFRKHLGSLAAAGYQTISLAEVVAYMHGDPLPVIKPIAITFDDGYQCLYDYALPALQQYRMTVTVFLSADFLGKTNTWEQAIGDVAEPILSRSQISEMMQAGIEFGSHTCGHVHLPQLSPLQAEREIRVSKERLEQALGQPCRFFAYPYGEYTPLIRDVVQAAGYEGACVTIRVVNRPGDDPFQMGRINVRRHNWVPRLKLKLRQAQRVQA